MKKLILFLIFGLMVSAGLTWAQSPNLNRVPPQHILASSYGGRDGETLSNVVYRLGTRDCVLIVDGDWYVTNNIIVSSNIVMRWEPGSVIHVATNKTLTIHSELQAGFYRILGGNGSTWAPQGRQLYSPTNYWTASDPSHYIAPGIIEREFWTRESVSNNFAMWMTNAYPNLDTGGLGQVWNLTEVLSNGQDGAGMQITNLSLVQAVTGQFDNLTLGGTAITGWSDIAHTHYGFVARTSGQADASPNVWYKVTNFSLTATVAEYDNLGGYAGFADDTLTISNSGYWAIGIQVALPGNYTHHRIRKVPGTNVVMHVGNATEAASVSFPFYATNGVYFEVDYQKTSGTPTNSASRFFAYYIGQ